MTHLTQQFIAIANRILQELRALKEQVFSLRGLSQQQIDTIREQGEAQKKREDAERSRAPVELTTPIPIRVDAETHERKNNWKPIKTALEVIGIAAVVLYAIVTYHMWGEMIQQNDLVANGIRQSRRDAANQLLQAQRQLEMTNRAWVGVEGKSVSQFTITLTKTSIRLLSRYKIQNFGNSPALHTLSFLALAPDHQHLDSMADNTCKAVRSIAEGKGQSVPPLAVKERGSTLFPKDDLETGSESEVPLPKDLTMLYAVGCIAYQDQFGWHRTRFCWESPVAKTPAGLQPTPVVTLCNVYNDAE